VIPNGIEGDLTADPSYVLQADVGREEFDGDKKRYSRCALCHYKEVATVCIACGVALCNIRYPKVLTCMELWHSPGRNLRHESDIRSKALLMEDDISDEESEKGMFDSESDSD